MPVVGGELPPSLEASAAAKPMADRSAGQVPFDPAQGLELVETARDLSFVGLAKEDSEVRIACPPTGSGP
jgi:hypothetical protein